MGAQVTVLQDVRVFDGERVYPRASLEISNGVIAEVGATADPPADAQVIDAAGQTVLPGLIDAHTHVFPGSLQQSLIFGVTTELDMFADPTLVRELKSVAGSRDDLADLRSAGTGATVAGGHPTGLVQRGIYPPFPTLSGPQEAEDFVAARIAEGSDYLKIFIDDGVTMGYPQPTLTADTIRALVTAAHQHGVLAIANVVDHLAAQLAVDAGVDGLAHLFVDVSPGRRFVDIFAQRGMFVIPTLVVLEAVCGRGHGPVMLSDPQFAAYLDSTSQLMLGLMDGNFPLGPDALVDFNAATAILGQLHQAGVAILAGSDAGTLGVAHGASIHRELQLLVEAGLSPIEALTAATAAPAARFGLTDRGCIHPGFSADLLLVDGDPTIDITATANIRGVWRRGTYFDRESLQSRSGGLGGNLR